MEESQKKDLQLAVKVHFDKHPGLRNLVKPTHYLRSPWSQHVGQQLHALFGTRGDETFYRIVRSSGASGNLMTFQKGPLAGLQTTSIVEGGKITSVAGLEKVDGHRVQDQMPLLLTMGAFDSINGRLNYITDICTDIRNRQISGDKAKLERISEVIVDCFESMAEKDERLDEDNLRRVTKNTDDCFEILSTLLDDLIVQHKDKPMDVESFDEYAGVTGHRYLATPTAAIRELMRHSVFAAYERYVAGRACQVVLRGNYSPSTIRRHKLALKRARDSIRKVFDERMDRHREGVEYLRRVISVLNKGYEEGNWSLENAQRSLKIQLNVIEELERELYELLDAKISNFDALVQIFRKGEFDIFIIDGAMIFSCGENPPELENKSLPSDHGLSITNQTPQELGLS